MALGVLKRSLPVKDADNEAAPKTKRKTARTKAAAKGVSAGKKPATAKKTSQTKTKPKNKTKQATPKTKAATTKTATKASKQVSKSKAATAKSTAAKSSVTKAAKKTSAVEKAPAPKAATKAAAKKTASKTKASKTKAKKAVPKTAAAKTNVKTKRASSSKADKANKAVKERMVAVKASTAKSGSAKRSRSTPPVSTAKKSPVTAKLEKDMHVHKPAPAEAQSVPLVRRDPLGHLVLEQLLREAGFRGGVSTDPALLEAYSTDESIFSIRPQIVLQPDNADDVATAAAVVAREAKRFTSLSLTPRSAGTGLSGGSLTDSVVLDVSAKLNQIGQVSYKQNEAFITCQPGVYWRDMEATLARVGYYVPTYPSSKDICSVGGAVGNNAAGAETLRYGHTVHWVTSLDAVLHDGEIHTVQPLTYKQFKALSKKKHAYAAIARDIMALLEKSEAEITKNKPHTKKNTAGYDIWEVLPQGVKAFKKGTGTFNLIPLIAGSQGTVGIITSITFRAIPQPESPTLLVVPVFDLQEVASVVEAAKAYEPIDMEVFDDRTFDLAMQHPEFFKQRLQGLAYYRTMLTMYTTYHVRYRRKLPELTIMITLDQATTSTTPASTIAREISTKRNQARVINNPIEEEMLWQIRRASYSLSKLQDDTKRPAAFLEDMTVPAAKLPHFLAGVKQLFKEFDVQATVHGHAGNGHFHFYPLLDFTNKTTPALVEKMSEKFFDLAIKHDGSICGEHNDGIIRTPYLQKMFSKKMVDVFERIEHIFDPSDIFNPGKKVHPRFEVRDVIRTRNY